MSSVVPSGLTSSKNDTLTSERSAEQDGESSAVDADPSQRIRRQSFTNFVASAKLTTTSDQTASKVRRFSHSGYLSSPVVNFESTIKCHQSLGVVPFLSTSNEVTGAHLVLRGSRERDAATSELPENVDNGLEQRASHFAEEQIQVEGRFARTMLTLRSHFLAYNEQIASRKTRVAIEESCGSPVSSHLQQRISNNITDQFQASPELKVHHAAATQKRTPTQTSEKCIQRVENSTWDAASRILDSACENINALINDKTREGRKWFDHAEFIEKRHVLNLTAFKQEHRLVCFSSDAEHLYMNVDQECAAVYRIGAREIVQHPQLVFKLNVYSGIRALCSLAIQPNYHLFALVAELSSKRGVTSFDLLLILRGKCLSRLPIFLDQDKAISEFKLMRDSNQLLLVIYELGLLIQYVLSSRGRLREVARKQFKAGKLEDIAFCAANRTGVVTFGVPNNAASGILNEHLVPCCLLTRRNFREYYRRCLASRHRLFLVEDAFVNRVNVFDFAGRNLSYIESANIAQWRVLETVLSTRASWFLHQWELVENDSELRVFLVTSSNQNSKLRQNLSNIEGITMRQRSEILKISTSCCEESASSLETASSSTRSGVSVVIVPYKALLHDDDFCRDTHFHSLVQGHDSWFFVDRFNNCIKAISHTGAPHVRAVRMHHLTGDTPSVNGLCSLNERELVALINCCELLSVDVSNLQMRSVVRFSVEGHLRSERAFLIMTSEQRLVVAVWRSGLIFDFAVDRATAQIRLVRKYKLCGVVTRYAHYDCISSSGKFMFCVCTKKNVFQIVVLNSELQVMQYLPKPRDGADNWSPFCCALHGDMAFVHNWHGCTLYVYCITQSTWVCSAQTEIWIDSMLLTNTPSGDAPGAQRVYSIEFFGGERGIGGRGLLRKKVFISPPVF